MKEGDIEILISTMNRNSFAFLYKMFPDLKTFPFSLLIINQTTVHKELISDIDNVRVINSQSIGSSKSRNLALQNATGKLVVISDDDVVFESDFTKKILDSYNKNNDVSAICFQAKNELGSLLKKYPSKEKKNISALDILNVGNIEITLNLQKIKNSGIGFDENFGLNAVFGLGEEAVFLSDLKNHGFRIDFVPKTIVMHPSITTSNKLKVSDRYFIYGALFSRIYKSKYLFWVLLKLFFDCKQSKIAIRSIPRLVKLAILGRQSFVSLSANQTKTN